MDYESIKTLLRNYTGARERRYRPRLIAEILQSHYPVLMTIEVNTISEIVGNAENMARYFRMAAMEDESLRGTDYNDKHKLAQQKQLSLGYSPGHEQQVKTLARL